MTLHDPATDLDEILRNVTARLRHRYPLVDPDEINLLVAEEAASINVLIASTALHRTAAGSP